jgi:hypothetical protein
VLRQGREVTSYSVERHDGQVASISQVIDYVTPAVSPDMAFAENRSRQVLEMWRKLQHLPPEAVLKRGSVDVDGEKRLRFQVIDAESVTGLEGYQAGVFVLVDPKTKCPISLQAGSTKWTGIRFNPEIPAERFTPPVVPEDLDAEVTWSFTLPSRRPEKEKFSFRVLDAQGKPIVTTADLQRYDSELGGADDLGPGTNAQPSSEPAGERVLTSDGINKLDGFMARNPGATITIEIAGEPPIRRTIYGRLSRTPGRGPVTLRLLSTEEIRAMTRPSVGVGVLPGRSLIQHHMLIQSGASVRPTFGR